MTREFIMTPEFDKHRKAGLADKESKALQEERKSIKLLVEVFTDRS